MSTKNKPEENDRYFRQRKETFSGPTVLAEPFQYWIHPSGNFILSPSDPSLEKRERSKQTVLVHHSFTPERKQ